jgi:gliding motility-associated-like protein
VVTNANTFESTFSTLCVDHTSLTGNMFVADGATNSSKKVWQQTIPVLPATNYTFSYWIQTVATPNPANIETQINGQPITGASATSTSLAPTTTCTWVPQTYNWNSGTNTTAEITLYNRTTNTTGNDFALDDINFSIPVGVVCPIQKKVVVTVNNGSVAPVTSFTYGSPVCINNTINPSPILAASFATGGVFSSTTGLSINAVTGVINLATSTPGSYTVSYMLPSTACSSTITSTANIIITGVTPAVTGFSYSTPICIVGTNPAPIKVANFTTGGTFTASSTNVAINATTGVINLAASTAGTYTITYTVAASGCNLAGSSITAITLNATQSPVTGFSYPTPVCITGTNPSPIPSAANFTTGGVYASTTGISINATTGVINLAASTAGVYQVTYTVAATGCFSTGTGQANIAIIANNPIVTGFTYTTPICANDTNPLPKTNTGFTAGGIFSSTPGLSVNPTTGAINLTTTSAGTYVVTYSLAPTACNILSSGTAPIVINTVPSPPATSPASRCGSGIVLLRANGAGTLNWYADVLLTNQVALGNTYSPTLITDATFYVTDSNATCKSSATAITATINPVPNKPNLGRDTAICIGEKIILNAGIYNTYTWQDGSTASILTANTTGNYIVTVNDGGVCNNADSIAINVLTNCDDVYFPTGFSPNGDGNNETFGPFGNVFFIKNYNCRVYDRFGQIVFSTNNPYHRWNGINASKPLAPGNYVFIATYKFKNVDKKQKGNIMLFR